MSTDASGYDKVSERLAAARAGLARSARRLGEGPALLAVFAIGLLFLFLIIGSLGFIETLFGSLVIAGLAVAGHLASRSIGFKSEGSAPGAAADAELINSLLDALPDPALVLGRDDTILHRNRRAAEMQERIRPGAHISGAIRNPDLLDALARARANGELQIVRYAERVPLKRQIEAIVAPAGEGRIAITLRDLTEAERVNRMRSDFIANASHELRTPLAAVLGFVETLQGPARDDPEARARFLSIIATEAGRMQRLIGDLSSLARIEMHEHVRPRGRVELNELLMKVVSTFAPMAAEAKIAISLAPLAGHAVVTGDEDELTQVFHNLVSNALRYGREGGRVEIKVARREAAGGKPPRIAVSVADDGIGIAEIHLHRLTERFYRADTAASRAKGGTGLGLAIVKHILIRHEGELQIESEPGNGSTFTVLLPVWID